MSTARTIYLYCTRMRDINDCFKLQADFGNEIKFTFNEGEQLHGKDNFVPFIYTLELKVKLDNNKQLCILHENSFKHIDEYHLIISRRIPFTINPKIHHQEKMNQGHKLADNFDNPYHFLFNIHFSKAAMMEPPGTSTNYFDDLCLFTYYLLHKRTYHLFDTLADQFQINLSNDNHTFDKQQYNDFFETCNLYIDNISADLEINFITLKIILRMIGLLPIETKSFSRYSRHANEFATKIMSYVRKNFDNLLKLLNKNEQLLFRSGLAILLCIELLYTTFDNSEDNKLLFLCQIPDEKQRQDIANEILAEFYKLNQPIFANSTWTDLFTIVNPNMIKLQEIYLTTSFETYIKFITKVSPVYPDSNHFYKKIIEEFKRLIYFNLQVDLEGILFLIKFIQCQLPSNHDATNCLLTEIRCIVESDQPLKYKINDYFNSIDVTIENIDDIGYILGLKSKCTILYNVNKNDFFCKSLKEDNSYEYYVKWFKCFLANSQAQDGNKPEQCKELLKAWTNCFEKDYSKFTKVLMTIDELLDTFKESSDNDWLRSFFIDHIIYLCFQQKSVFRLIVDGLLKVKNERFRMQFKTMFEKKYLTHERHKLFKEITNKNNSLSKLIELDRTEDGQSTLVHDLIQVVCDNIEVTKDALMDDTFNKPTKSTFTYTILFADSFRTVPIHIKIIKQLTIMWEEWEKDGFQADEIKTWSKLKNDQRQVARDIWNVVRESAGKTISFEQLIDETNRKKRMLITIKENITLCINNYCQEAYNKKFYDNLLEQMETEINQKPVFSIQVSKDIEKLEPYTDRLNPIFSSHVWQEFLKHNTEFKNLKTNAIHDEQQTTCLTMLKQVTEILDQFTTRLKVLCTNIQEPLLPQLKQLFPEKSLIDHEFSVLKSLLDANTVSHFGQLLEYWKTREHITRICHACINLMTQYNISSTEKVSVLQNILDIDDQTSVETCSNAYAAYCAHYSKKYSELMHKLIAQWSSSKELLEFLCSLTSTDVDDLLELVNDWDETLINTKTVLDFVLLKRFLRQVDVMIEPICAEKPLELSDIIVCFEKVWEQAEFKNILINFESCSKSLFSIKRISTGSTNKEQSKRKRILDIMKNSRFSFCIHQSKETINGGDYQFDVHIMNNNWEPNSFDELSELRDRARLIEYATNNKSNLQNYTHDYAQQLRSFVSFVETIEVILESLTSLNTAGYPVVKQYPMSERKFTCREGNYDELDKFKSSLKSQLADWEKQLCTMYEKCIDLTYFSYQQVWIVENSLYKQTATTGDDLGYHLLKFIGIDPESIRSELLSIKSKNPNDRLQNMAQILSTQRICRNFPLQEDGQIHKKVFLVETSNKGILRAIYSCFHLNNVPVIANQLFYCTMDTNWIEIRAFIYRCFYSQTLHQLIRPELLSSVIQDKFAQLLNQLIEQNPKHFFLLSIITTVSSAHLHIVNGLRTHRLVQTVQDQDMLSNAALSDIIRPIIGDNSVLITSSISGLGKSTYVRNESLRLGKRYVKFPISGNVDIDTLVERLCNKEIQLASSTILIHIDIGPIENIQQLNEFLYCLVLFRCFRLRKTSIHVSANIPVYIELDASSYLAKLKDDIVIFKYLQTKHLNHLNWDELNINNSSTIQLVAHYLQAIEDETIIKRDITEETIAALDKSICIRLLQKYFLPKKNPEFVSWTQLSIFITVYYKLFSGFSKCGYFLVESEHLSSLRLDILTNLLNASDQFTSLSVETVRKNQRSIHGQEIFIPFSEAIIRWDKSQPFTIIFTSTYNPLLIYKKLSDVPPSLINALLNYYQIINENRTDRNRPQSLFFSLFNKRSSQIKTPKQHLEEFLIDPNQMTHEQFFLRLTSLSTKYFSEKSICETCFKQYECIDQQCTICLTKNILIRPSSSDTQDIQEFQKTIAKKLQSEYILTADNYIKMLLIYLRVQSNLPVLIMGETGCGKTALIQFLCQKLLDDEMAVFRIHAGVTNEKIIETIHEYVRKAHKCSKTNQNKRLWVFLDEFNTTANIGLLKEIVCERTLLGKALPKNMVFLGACNPQRCKKKKEESEDDIGIKKHHSDLLRQVNAVSPSSLYSVVPIPETMLEYVWDYGYLDEATEMSYVTAIVNVCEDLMVDDAWFNCIVNLIVESQKLFREREDVSSVSLRDVVRFCRFYNWFYKFAISDAAKQVLILPSINNIERASLIALFLCYYFRLDSSTKRNEYINIIGESIRKYKPHMSFDVLNTLLQNEKMSLVERMELPAGTAKNRALTDNIFVLFTCILNRIPVILCGKPGSSKTSAVQIVISNLKGKNSNDRFFQTLPELIAVSYQGSQSCTSESIIKVFVRADRYTEAKSEIELLPVIVFDEIGLAELSPHNPLKVLHSELEIEACRHGFVGLSNWRLDASKMNRALYLSCPDPDLDDLKTTAITLSQSMLLDGTQAVPLADSIIEGLANSYMNMCDHLRQHKNQYYFGLRDYYSLIKGIVRDTLLKNNERQDLYGIIRHQLSVNFDGTTDGSKFMWSKFCEHIQENCLVEHYLPSTFDKLIHQSLSARTGRFLMLIGESESAFDHIQRYINIKHPSIQTRTLIGSTLVGDFLPNTTYTEQYNTRVLMDIILYAETNITLFLRQLGHLYDNLYDLFNQNFAVSAKKKFCRIALGSLYHPRCIIHDNFYCVVFVKQQDLDKYDPPFLNRFEKHIIDMNTLIHDHHKDVMSTLVKWIDDLLSIKPSGNFPLPKHLFIEYSDDYIFNLVTDVFDHVKLSNINDDSVQENKSTQDVVKYCENQIIRTSSFDFPLLLALRSQTNRRNETYHLIQRYYETHTDLSFSSFINKTFEKEKITKLLIYTYTQIYHDIDYSKIKNHDKWIAEARLSDFKTELELIQKIKTHYQTGHVRLLCIRVDYHQEHVHIPMLKHILLNEHVVDGSHGICLIFHLQRNKLNQTDNDVFFNGWSSVMIDDLQEHILIPQNILINPLYQDLVIHLNFLNLETTFDELLSRCIMKFRYQVTNEHFEAKINERRDRIIQQLTLSTVKHGNDHQPLRSLIKNHLSKMIENIAYDSNQTHFKDWRQDLLTNEIIIGSCHSFNDALTKTVSFFVDNYLSLLLAHLEKHSLIDSYVFLMQSDEKIRNKLSPLWFDCWTRTIETIDMSIINQTNIEIPLNFDLHLPCATYEYEIIRQIRETIAPDRENSDKNLIDFTWKQLISKSIYGQSINKILQDSDLFIHYYHDQLTLARNEANIHQLSSSFIQRLTSKISGSGKDRLRHLLIDYEELFETMRLFEIGMPFIGDEDTVFQILDQHFITNNNSPGEIIQNNSDLYCLLREDTSFYQIPPKLFSDDRLELNGQGDPFIETSLMNLIELLISPIIIDRMNDIEQLITVYGLFIQSMYTLSHYDYYEITNLEKFHSFLYLASFISVSLPIDKVINVFKEVYRYSGFCTSLYTLDQIHNFISYLNKVIHQQQSITNDTIIHQRLIKFENELLNNWFIGNNGKCSDVLKFITDHDHDLWKYSAKIFTLIDKSLKLSSIIRENNRQIPQNDEYKEINQYLCQLNDPTRKIEILIATRVYMQLILDENYELQIHKDNNQQIITMLTTEFDHFKKAMCNIEDEQYDQRLELISFVAWLRYYTEHYAYALKNDIKHMIMNKINDFLAQNVSAFCWTVKLFIIKQLCYFDNTTFSDLCGRFANRNVNWINSMTDRLPDQRALDARHNLILPTPLFECHDKFIYVDRILTSNPSSDQLRELIKECSTNQHAAYCFIIWFIHYYSRFYMSNIQCDDQFVKLVKQDVEQELIACFGLIGYKLLVSLCNNFDKKSYFQLNPSIPEETFHQRLFVLNIIAILLSFKSFQSVSLLGFLLYDGNREMPQNYTEHFRNFGSLIGVASLNDRSLIRMINIRTRIDEQTKTDHQVESKTHIFRCSPSCFWIFYFENCEIPDEQRQCPLCKKEINIIQNDDFLVINKPHIQMNMCETLQFIFEYIEKHKQKYRLEKPDHLKQPVTYDFMNILAHAIFLFLNELNFMPNSTTVNCTYLQECIETHYALLRKHLSNVDQCYIWLYKLINYMIHKDFVIRGYLNDPKKIIQLEKLIEEKLIFPHIDSVISEIREYKLAYADFVYGDNKKQILANFVDELIQDDEKYPLLNFFNVTNIHSIDFINDFYSKLQLLLDFDKKYPLTTFLLKHLSDYDNIQHLYPIIKFMNYLIQQFNHRIKRNDAKIKTISDYLKRDSHMKTVYEQFLDAWYNITLNEVYFDHRKYEFQHSQLRHNFENETNISMFLLNKSSDNESILLAACLQTIGNLQNDIVNYFQSHIVNYTNKNEKHHRIIPIQSIQQKHLFHFDTNKIRKHLVEKGLMINYTYGMGRDIIYDYEEVEWILRNEISCLPLIDIENMQFFNYQFELYDENISLINDVRRRFEQKLFDDHERTEIKRIIDYLDNDSILQLSGSLEYILTYLRTVNNKNIIETSNIQTFINEYIHSKTCIDNRLFGQKPFSSIHLKYIIDLYELMEECIFDKILRNNVRNELCEKSFPIDQRMSIVHQFIEIISPENNIAECSKDLICWISMFKRLLVRLLSPKVNINFDSPLHDYVKRTDMWKGNVTKDDIRAIQINKSIRLKHAYIILNGLEEKQNELMVNENQRSVINAEQREQKQSVLQKTSITSRSINSSQKGNEYKRRNAFR